MSKLLQNSIILSFGLLLGPGFLQSSSAALSIAPGKTEVVPALSVQGLDNYRGNYVSILYAIANQAFAGNQAPVNITELRYQSSPQVIGSFNSIFPRVELMGHGNQLAYNFVVVVIHKSQKFTWINPDEPGGSQIDFNFLTIPRATIQILQKNQSNPALLNIDLKHLPSPEESYLIEE